MDTIGRRFSQSFSFSTAAWAPSTTFDVLSSDPQGWINAQLSLGSLASFSTPEAFSSTDANSSYVSSSFDQIWIRDKSGQGFVLHLDEISIGSPSSYSVPSASDLPISANLEPTIVADAVPPVYGSSTARSGFIPLQIDFPPLQNEPFDLPSVPLFDPPSAFLKPQRYIMKLSPGSSLSTLQDICKELLGLGTGLGNLSSRFSGSCDPIFQDDNIQDLSWPFQSFTSASNSDLEAMTAALFGQVSYFEPDYHISLDDDTVNKPASSPPPDLSLVANMAAPVLTQTSSTPVTPVTTSSSVRSWGLDRIDQSESYLSSG